MQADVKSESSKSRQITNDWNLQPPRNMLRRLGRASRGLTLKVVAFLCLLWVVFNVGSGRIKTPSPMQWRSRVSGYLGTSQVQAQDWQKPADLEVIGLVFYGRWEMASILNCYLKKNLAENGGILDKVIFVVRNATQPDMDWLEAAVDETESYSMYDARNTLKRIGWDKVWRVCEKGPMYIKIDDDVVFIEDSTIPSMVQRKYENPQYLLVSANVVNSPALSWVHYHLGAVKPYLPELNPPRKNQSVAAGFRAGKPSWRASELPEWEGPANFKVGPKYSPPFRGHRWLPLPVGSDIRRTPISKATYGPFGPGWSNWTTAAQEHYSFLDRLENNELDRYKFDTWDMVFQRLSINMIAVMGDDIVANRPIFDDEIELTITLPRKLGRTVVVAGNALAVHFSFFAQVTEALSKGVRSTDALSRYKAYAEEFICST